VNNVKNKFTFDKAKQNKKYSKAQQSNAKQSKPKYRVVQLKWGQLTFLMLTFKCIGKIQYILVNVITVIQAHTLEIIKV